MPSYNIFCNTARPELDVVVSKPFVPHDTYRVSGVRVKWKSTDPWRGYYIVESEKYAMVNTAELLAYHESGAMLEEFDQRIRKLFDEAHLDYARVFARSSNVFYQNYELFVRKDQLLFGSLLVAKAKGEVDYGNPKWYRNILFDENTLVKISELFPEYNIRTDKDVMMIINEVAEELLPRLNKKT